MRRREKIVWRDFVLGMCQGEFLEWVRPGVVMRVHMNFRFDGEPMPQNYDRWFVSTSENPRRVADLQRVDAGPETL